MHSEIYLPYMFLVDNKMKVNYALNWLLSQKEHINYCTAGSADSGNEKIITIIFKNSY
jgi:hypothetical protein